MVIKDLDKKIKAYVLKNAIAYKGKANPGSVISALFNEGLEKKDVKKVMPQIQKTIKEIEKLSLEDQEKEFEKLHKKVSERHLGINFQNLSENNKYIEFRYIGGSDYHKKWDKVKQIVGNYIWNMSIALDPEYKKKEYINKLIRIIEKTDIDISDDSYYGKKKKWED